MKALSGAGAIRNVDWHPILREIDELPLQQPDRKDGPDDAGNCQADFTDRPIAFARSPEPAEMCGGGTGNERCGVKLSVKAIELDGWPAEKSLPEPNRGMSGSQDLQAIVDQRNRKSDTTKPLCRLITPLGCDCLKIEHSCTFPQPVFRQLRKVIGMTPMH